MNLLRKMAGKEIWSAPAGLYRPLSFLLFMDQGGARRQRDREAQLAFPWGTVAVYVDQRLMTQVWHVHHYGVTVAYKLKQNRVIVSLYDEAIPLNEGSLRNPPLSEVERIIENEAKNPEYARLEREYELQALANA